MKKILLIICLFPILVFSQKSYKIPADSTILNNIGSGKNELVIRNATSNITGGVLTNLGNGVTAFVLGGGSARVVDTIYKNNTKDSIVFTISGIRYAVKDSFNLNTDSQTLSISNDTLTISGGNSVILPVYIQIDSSTINSYDVLNSQNTPPISPNTGDVYLVGNVPTGAWVGHAKDIAEWNGSSWDFTDGVQGDFLYNATNALTYIFRSGNWVQTTGIPALNNGNTISSGLRIGTNNARSLTFETNNVNRGRFDSIGRYYIYDTSLRYSNKYIQVDSLTGRLIATEIPYNDGFIPLSGTEVGKPVTGDISYGVLDGSPKKINYTNADGLEEGIILGGDGSQYDNNVKNGFVTNFLDTSYSFVATGSNGVIIGSFNTNRSTDNWLLENTNDGHKIGFLITNNFSGATGLSGGQDFSANITDLDYTQKIYVDQRISDTATQIRSEIADTASSLYTLINAKVSASGTATLTNKRITARVDSTASSATPTINTDNVDTYKLTAQAVDITSFTTNLSGTPTDDQILHIVIIGTATRAITWGSKFEASTVALPTTTVSTNRLDVYFIWNTAVSKWRCGGVW